MIFVIMNYGVSRNQEGRHWLQKGLLFALAASAVATACGFVIGALGLLLDESLRLLAAGVVSGVAIVLVVASLVRHAVRLPERNCETGQLWMNAGALAGAALNGGALGAGIVTRIGFWIWYAVPAAAFLSGSPFYGALIFGCYGFVRGAAPLIAIAQLVLRRDCSDKDLTRLQEQIFMKRQLAARFADAGLLTGAMAAGVLCVF